MNKSIAKRIMNWIWWGDKEEEAMFKWTKVIANVRKYSESKKGIDWAIEDKKKEEEAIANMIEDQIEEAKIKEMERREDEARKWGEPPEEDKE